MRKLSVVGRVNSSNEDPKMGSDSEDELRSTTSISKRFNLPKKFFFDTKRVDYASVPRKLRSAMKKRNWESISPPLLDKKPRKDGRKKSRLNEKQGEPILGLITKDEEEVAQTLFALAEMFPNNDEKDSSDGEFAKTKSSPLREGESLRPAFEDSAVSEKEENSKSLSNAADATNSSLLERSAQDTVDVKCSNEQSTPNSILLHTDLVDAFSQRNFLAISVGFNVQSEMSMGNGSKGPKHEEAVACEIEAAAISSHPEVQKILKESKNSGSALWPRLSSAGSDVAGTRGPSLQSSNPMIPAWLGITSAAATQPSSLDNGSLTDKDSRGPVARKKSWKRCSAHAYICRLIKVLQISDKALDEGSKQGGVLFTTSNPNGVRNGMNEAVSVHNISSSSTSENNPNEVGNGVLLHTRLLHDQQQASTPSSFHTSLKQSFDFLSLSAGGGSVEAPNTQFNSPYPQSLPQNHPIMPFSLPENHFSSTSFTHHLPSGAIKQVQIQPPTYIGNPLLGHHHLGSSAPPKHQQQRWIWPTQQATQYKPMGPLSSLVPNWQNGRQESSSPTHYAHSSSLEVLGPKYAPISPQQLQLFAVTSSLPTARDKGQHHLHNLPSDAALPLQLLCSEHL